MFYTNGVSIESDPEQPCLWTVTNMLLYQHDTNTLNLVPY